MDFFGIDRKKLQKITLTVIASLTLISLVLLLIVIIASVEGQDPNKIDYPNIDNVDEIEFEDTVATKDILSHGSLLLVNGEHKYDIPSNLSLELISTYRNAHYEGDSLPYGTTDINNMKLESTTMRMAHQMLFDLSNETEEFVYITSGFRSIEEQTSKLIPPGYSEHHTGMLMCLKNDTTGSLSEICSAWLAANSYKYGFIQRYPTDKDELTGIEDYTNAYRYVGIPHASYIVNNNLCLEEYISYLKDNTNYKKPLSVKAYDNNTYLIYYAEASEGDKFKTPLQNATPDGSLSLPFTVSGTNEGGVVVTIIVN